MECVAAIVIALIVVLVVGSLAHAQHIRTREVLRRESIKAGNARLKKGRCYKHSKTRKQALSYMNNIRAGRDVPLWVYKCPKCGYWHVTKKPQN
jgi:rubrerythrin